MQTIILDKRSVVQNLQLEGALLLGVGMFADEVLCGPFRHCELHLSGIVLLQTAHTIHAKLLPNECHALSVKIITISGAE